MAMTYMPFHSFGNHAGGKSSSGMFIAEAGVIRRLAQDGPANYDLVVNTGRASLDKIADAIIKYIDTLK